LLLVFVLPLLPLLPLLLLLATRWPTSKLVARWMLPLRCCHHRCHDLSLFAVVLLLLWSCTAGALSRKLYLLKSDISTRGLSPRSPWSSTHIPLEAAACAVREVMQVDHQQFQPLGCCSVLFLLLPVLLFPRPKGQPPGLLLLPLLQALPAGTQAHAGGSFQRNTYCTPPLRAKVYCSRQTWPPAALSTLHLTHALFHSDNKTPKLLGSADPTAHEAAGRHLHNMARSQSGSSTKET